MKSIVFISSASLLMLGLTTSVAAHHSSAPHFDNSVDLTLEGVVTDWKMVNPHGYIYFDVTTDGETVNWRCETTSASALSRMGFTNETFEVGAKITIKGNPARREANHCYASSFVFADGSEVARYGSLASDTATDSTEGAEGTTEQPRAEYLADGQPNISGYWVRGGRGGPPGGGPPGGRPPGGRPPPGAGGRGPGGPGGGSNYESTEAALAVQEAYEQIYDDPSIHCDIANILFGWTHDSHVNAITQEKDKVIIQYGYMDYVRTIHLGMSEHPDNIVPSRGGHSIGGWVDAVLVVDTVGFTTGVLHPLSGVPHSDQMHTVEKISYDAESKTLKRSYVIEDPLYLKSNASGHDEMSISEKAYEPYNCTELSGDNNTRPEDRN
jgi:hypothetical protein